MHPTSITRSTLPEHIPLTDPYLTRLATSSLLNISPDNTSPSSSPSISTLPKALYGPPSFPILFSIGNGGAGYTGILSALCTLYIRTHGDNFRIAWISNHSRHTQIALLADIVQVGLTYEPKMERMAEREGWCERVGEVMGDRFLVVGPRGDSAGLGGAKGVHEAFRRIAEGGEGAVFHTRGDGSATFMREQELWKGAGMNAGGRMGLDVKTYALPPYQALVKAEEEGAYLLTDRSTYLTAKNDGVIPGLMVYVEGGEELANPCSAVVNTKTVDDEGHRAAKDFASWLLGAEAQAVIAKYGSAWRSGKRLYTVPSEAEFNDLQSLVGVDLEALELQGPAVNAKL